MNYHLLTDEKFIDGFIDAAEKVAPGLNVYIFTFSGPPKYVKSELKIRLPLGTPGLTEYLSKLNGDDKVFVHWFSDELFPHLNHVPSDVKIGLMFWGGDFLEQHPEFIKHIYEPLTFKIVERLHRRSAFYKTVNPVVLLRQVYDFCTTQYRWRKYYAKAVDIRCAFLKRLNLFCHWNIEDMHIVQRLYGGMPEFKNFFYDFGFSQFEEINEIDAVNDEKIIWLGNSATFPNNHADAIVHLKDYAKENIKFIAPLSYGNVRYRNIVSRMAKRYFGNKFIILKDFIPFSEYLKIIKGVDVVVMYHKRTQGAANIFALLRMGKKVFLKPESTIFTLAHKNGIKVFNANSIAGMPFQEFIQPLTFAEKKQNQAIVNEMFSEEKRYRYLSEVLN